MNPFDEIIIRFLNQFANRSPEFDSVMVFIRTANVLKGGVIVGLLWWVWFSNTDNRARNREIILATFLGAFGAMFAARALAFLLPFRFRPLHDAAVGFHLPYGMVPEALDGWSSFPSDHAALFFALTTGLCFVSCRLGLIATLYTIFVICFPRVYLGLHYPTDIIGGALISVSTVWMTNQLSVRDRTVRPALAWVDRHPSSFYPAFFLISQQIVNLFEDVRVAGSGSLALLKRIEYFLQ